MTFQKRFDETLNQIALVCKQTHRNPSEVTLLAVSKTVGIEEVREAYEAGARHFGENRPDALVEKASQLPEATWHFIGNIQSRRIPDIVAYSHLIHSVCSASHLEKINEAAARLSKVQKVLLEVNVSGEETKSGFDSQQASTALLRAQELPHVMVCGLMTMAPQGDSQIARACFDDLSSLVEELRSMLSSENASVFNELSMGMSEDWPEAVSAGGTIVRIGRALFSSEFSDHE